MFWKKCEPCESGTCSPEGESSADSTMMAERSMCCQLTGMPAVASLEPQRSGAISMYLGGEGEGEAGVRAREGESEGERVTPSARTCGRARACAR